jgi:hypothetical protein
MKCPLCDAEMQPGCASCETTGFGTVVSLLGAVSGVPTAPHYLYFRPQGNGTQPVLVEELGRAFRCRRCLTVVIAGEELAPEDEAAAEALLAEIDGLVAQGQSPAAARRYREATGDSWDMAHFVLDRWKQLPPEQKRARLAGALHKKRKQARPLSGR